jgi:hypothetical protein
MLKSLNTLYRERLLKGGPGSGRYHTGPREEKPTGTKVQRLIARWKATSTKQKQFESDLRMMNAMHQAAYGKEK